MKTNKIQLISAGILSAIVIIFTSLPQISFFYIGNRVITFIYTFIIIAAIICGYFGGFVVGLCFGISLFMVANFSSYEAINTGFFKVFQNFFVATIPPTLFGLIITLSYNAFKRTFSNKYFLNNFLAILLSLIVHVFITYISALIFAKDIMTSLYGQGYEMLKFILQNNTWVLIEIAINLMISFIAIVTLDLFNRRRSKN